MRFSSFCFYLVGHSFLFNIFMSDTDVSVSSDQIAVISASNSFSTLTVKSSNALTSRFSVFIVTFDCVMTYPEIHQEGPTFPHICTCDFRSINAMLVCSPSKPSLSFCPYGKLRTLDKELFVAILSPTLVPLGSCPFPAAWKRCPLLSIFYQKTKLHFPLHSDLVMKS